MGLFDKRHDAGLALTASCITLLISGCAYPEANSSAEAPQSSQAFPLDEYLSFVLGSGFTDEENARISEQRIIREEELIAQCMNSAGFDYVPYLGNQLNFVDFRSHFNDENWVSQYGYGTFHPDAITRTTLSGQDLHSETDPNRAIFDSLSETEQQAWRTALAGPPGNSSIGCRIEAIDKMLEEQPGALFTHPDGEFRPLFEAWRQMSESIFRDFDGDRDWANCMADAGYPGFVHQWDALNQIGSEHFDIIWNQQNVDLNPTNSPEMAALQHREIEMALADLNCRNIVNYQARLNQRRFEIETQFIADHRVALAALRDAAEQQGVSWLD